MKIINFIQINDWPIKKFFLIIFSLQLIFWGSICLDLIGFKIPILRPLACSIYLTLVPGFIILRILKLHKLESIESILYSVGLSLSVLMFIGFFINTFYPVLSFKKPISIFPLAITISGVVLLLCMLCYLVDKKTPYPNYLCYEKVALVPLLFLCLIPILTIIGTYLMNFHSNNYLLIIIIFLISLIIILVALDLIPNNLYPLSIFIISFSLLFHNSLISMYVSGWDIQTEHYLINQVISSSLWNPTIYSNVNCMLSIVMIAPIYSILCNLDPIWVLKIVYPAIFSLMPLGLYLIFKKQAKDKVAFISVFFFVSVFVFYTEMLQLARQQIAEYFFMLIILLIIKNKRDVSHTILLVLFSFSVVVSHYGLSYLVISSIIGSLLLLFFYRTILHKPYKSDILNLNFTLLFVTFIFVWYIYISSSSALYSMVHIFENIISSFVSDFLNINKAQGAYIITKDTATPLHKFAKHIHIFTQVCISIGLYFSIFSPSLKKKYQSHQSYMSLSIVFYLILIAAIIIPNFSNSLNTSRIYQISLILLAPFCVLGLTILLNLIFNLYLQIEKDQNKVSLNTLSKNSKTPLYVHRLFKDIIPKPDVDIKIMKVLSIFFMVFLLFNSGWIYEVTKDSPTSFSLNNSMDFPKFSTSDITGKEWLHKVNNLQSNNGYVYADDYRFILFLRSENGRVHNFPLNSSYISRNSYLYFSSYNSINNKILIDDDYFSLDLFTSLRNQIYDSRKVQIYISD